MRRSFFAGPAAVAAALLLAASASAFDAGTTLLQSRLGLIGGTLPFDGVNDSGADRHDVSLDGRYVVFESDADALSSEDDDVVGNVFRLDRQTGTLELASRGTGVTGAPIHEPARMPTISGNGNVVAFVTSAAHDPADTNGSDDVYVRDMTAHTTTLVSRATGAAGAVGASYSFGPALNDTGSIAAFSSWSKLDPANDKNTTIDVYTRDVGTSTTTLISRKDGANTDNAGSSAATSPAINGAGTIVAFATYTSYDAAHDSNGTQDVYERAGTSTALVSRASGASSQAGNGWSGDPSISQGGTRVAFTSSASNLDPGNDVNGVESDVFYRDTSGGFTALVSLRDGPGSVSGNGGSNSPAISGDGSRVAFRSGSTNLGDGDTDDQFDLHVRRMSTGTTTLVSRASGAGGQKADATSDWPSLSQDGSVALFGSSASNLTATGDPRLGKVFVRAGTTTELVSRPSGPATTPFSGGAAESVIGFVPGSALSADGRWLVFSSWSHALSGNDDDRFQNVYLRDVSTGDVRVLSRRADGTPANGDSNRVTISADGSTVVFTSEATNLVSGDTLAVSHLYAVDVASGTIEIADVANGVNGVQCDGGDDPSLSADGSRLAFSCYDALDPIDVNGTSDVYVRDLRAHTTLLVSRADGAAGAIGDGSSMLGSIDASGTRVAFATTAKNLGDGDTDAMDDVHLRDLRSSRTLLVSRADGAAGAKANDFSSFPEISGDGHRVAFVSRASNLGDGAPGNRGHVHVRDIDAGTIVLASRADGPSGTPGNSDSGPGRLTADGTKVVFDSQATNLVAGVPVGIGQVYLRDLATGGTTLVSRADGVLGAPAERDATNASLDADAGCVAFDSSASNLESPSYPSPDFQQVHLRAVGQCLVGQAVPIAGPGPGPGAGAGQPSRRDAGRDTVAPVVSGVTLSRTRFAVSGKATAVSARTKRTARRRRVVRGTTVRYGLSEAATVTFTFARPVKGRRVGKRCVKATGRLRGRRACGLVETFGTLTRRAGAGSSSLPFTGRVGRRALMRGRWTLTVVARDGAGNRSGPRAVTFTVVAG